MCCDLSSVICILVNMSVNLFKDFMLRGQPCVPQIDIFDWQFDRYTDKLNTYYDPAFQAKFREHHGLDQLIVNVGVINAQS